MISEKKLLAKMEEILEERRDMPYWNPHRLDGYIDCFNDVQVILENMVQDNRIKAKCQRERKKLMKQFKLDF